MAKISAFKTLTKSADCFSCPDPCCRFAKEDVYFAPVLDENELAKLRRAGHSLAVFKKGQGVYLLRLRRGRQSGQGRLAGKEIYVCPLLDEASGACIAYRNRPFDCSLWPFIFSRSADGHRVILAVFKDICPSLNKLSAKEKKEYLSYLKEYLEKTDCRKRLQKYPALIWDYEPATEELLTIF